MPIHTTEAVQMIAALTALCQPLCVREYSLSGQPDLNQKPFGGFCRLGLIFPSSPCRTQTMTSVLLSQQHRFLKRPLNTSFQAFRLSFAVLAIQPQSKIPLAAWNSAEEYFFVIPRSLSGLAADYHLL